MNTLTLTWSQVSLLVALVLAVYALEMVFFYWRLRKHHFTEKLALVRLRNLENAVDALQRALDGGARPAPASADDVTPPRQPVAAVPAEPLRPAISVSFSPPSIEEATSAPDDSGASYAQAIELARVGADSARLMRECGLSRGEADLIVSLYGRSKQR